MNLKLTSLSDVRAVLNIISDAQVYLAELGIDQWQDGYPDKKQIELDIQNEDSYVVTNANSEIMGTTVFTTKKEPTYKEIEGKWLTKIDAKYGVIHRMAVGDNYRNLGLGEFIFISCEEKLSELNIESMRIDTHRDNIGMQYMLKKRGYKYCGIIYVDRGDERLAFEKLISTN